MADDLQKNLSTYKLQFQQVEDALMLDTENEDLLKLKTDLQVSELLDELRYRVDTGELDKKINERCNVFAKAPNGRPSEVIQLTSDLIGQKQAPADVGEEAGTSQDQSDKDSVPVRQWQPGEKCLAIYSEDKMYYEATVDEVLEDGSCTVTFDEYGNTDVTEVSLLKPRETEGAKKRAATGDAGPEAKKSMSKKDKQAQEREYKRKKSQKKVQRQKQLEEERELEKNKWLDFNTKTFSKTSKGRVKKSIFATPDAVEGKVGVGTCGKGGKPMTNYTHQEKWKK